MLDNIIEIGMLYDFYGELLPQKQKRFSACIMMTT